MAKSLPQRDGNGKRIYLAGAVDNGVLLRFEEEDKCSS